MTSMRKNTSRLGFTLVELLVTVGIMAVIITLTIPSFTGLGRGAKMDSALSGLKSTFSLARQWSITHRDTVYVVFPSGRVRSDTGIYAYRTYMVFSENDQEMIREPASLPEGVIFEPDQLQKLDKNLPEWIDTEISQFARGANYLSFEQDGSLTSGATPKKIHMIEGTSDTRGNISTTFEREGGEVDRIVINGITGIAYVERDADPDTNN